MADLSFTLFPADDPPMKKLYALPAVLLVGLSRDLNKPLKIPIILTILP
jgi:hypothetical protein